ncbi:MAG: tripartite tricarboxylate transporter permease [Candidatus Rokubacteria bacterium]|nr:tripartite tricarboxylate transporter permease [Candidatus Rokubacteria bacterium]
MDFLQNLLFGFQVVLHPTNLFLAFVGCVIGTLTGVLPGLGPSAAIALLLPGTFHLTPVGAIIMLAGIYYGAMYGGSTTSVLVNIPGETASVVTCLDGYRMACQGRAGPALAVCAIGSFIAGTLSVVGLMLMAPTLAQVALSFGPPEYTSLMIVGFVILTFLASSSMPKALIMAAFGLFLSTIGLDAVSGESRFTLDIIDLNDGIGLVPVVMGLFGISEVLLNLEQIQGNPEILKGKILHLYPTREDWAKLLPASLRGTIVGFFLGILPGGGAVLSSFVSYAIEKRTSKYPEKFGTGVIEGVAAPESANNAATGGAFVPLLTLGIPANIVMAILLGAFMIHGITPGPMIIQEHPDVFWGLIASMYLGNVMLLILNLPLVGIWVQLLRVPYKILFPLILLFCLTGVYSVSMSRVDILVMIIFGVVGYVSRKTGYEAAPLILALVLGGMFENSLRQSLMMSGGNPSIFFLRPISFAFMLIAIVLLLVPVVLRRKPVPLLVEAR